MSNGTWVDYHDVIKAEDVRNKCPIEYNDFMAVLIKHNCDFNGFAFAASTEETIENCDAVYLSEAANKEIIDIYNLLYDAFKKETGLQLEVIWAGEGDVYDDYSEEGIWTISDAYIMSPEARALEKEGIHILRGRTSYYG